MGLVGGMLGKLGNKDITRLRICKYLKKCGVGNEYFLDNCWNDANEPSIYRSLIVLTPNPDQTDHAPSIREGGNKGFEVRGEKMEGTRRLKCFLNWFQILSDVLTHTFLVYGDRDNPRGEYNKAFKEVGLHDKASICSQAGGELEMSECSQ